MRKLIVMALTLLLIFSCSKDDNTSPSPDNISSTPDNTSPPEETITLLKTLSVNIELPTDSNVLANDLTVSSLFSENKPVNSSSAEIEAFNEDSMELTFATNTEGNLVMLSYFNPGNSEIVKMNTETTALALVMLHPWSFDLSANAKAEAISYIKNLPEFNNYKNVIEKSISDGELNPLNTATVLEKVMEIQQVTFNRISEYYEPLEFKIENSTASVKNLISSASYSVGLYDENEEFIEHKLAEGLDKSHFLFQEFKNNFYQETPTNNQTATFNIPTDGKWTLKAKSGLSFDGSLENQQAAFYNTKTVMANVMGIFSTQLKSLIKNGNCFISLGERAYKGISETVNVANSLQSYSNGTISGYILFIDMVKYTLDRIDSVLNIIDECLKEDSDLLEQDKIKPGSFKKILGLMKVLSKAENVFNTSAMLTDWVQFDKEIEYCFSKNGTNIGECVGKWYKGTYTLDHWGTSENSNSSYNCGSQYGQSGEVYIYVGNIYQEKQIVVYYKSIISGLPNIYIQPYQSPLYNIININSFRVDWDDNPGTDKMRQFDLGWLRISDDKNTIIPEFGGVAAKYIPSGTGGPECRGFREDYAFFYDLETKLTAVGVNPPSSLSELEIKRMDSLVGNYSITEIIIE